MNMAKEFLWWIDGHKTEIGGTIMFLSLILTQVFVGIWGAQADWIPKLAATFDWIGAAIVGVGLAHKGVKKASP